MCWNVTHTLLDNAFAASPRGTFERIAEQVTRMSPGALMGTTLFLHPEHNTHLHTSKLNEGAFEGSATKRKERIVHLLLQRDCGLYLVVLIH